MIAFSECVIYSADVKYFMDLHYKTKYRSRVSSAASFSGGTGLRYWPRDRLV